MLLYCGSSLSDVQITVNGVFFLDALKASDCIWCNVSKEKTKKRLNDIILMSWDRKVRRIRGRERTVSWLNHKQKKKSVPVESNSVFAPLRRTNDSKTMIKMHNKHQLRDWNRLVTFLRTLWSMTLHLSVRGCSLWQLPFSIWIKSPVGQRIARKFPRFRGQEETVAASIQIHEAHGWHRSNGRSTSLLGDGQDHLEVKVKVGSTYLGCWNTSGKSK